MARIGQFMGPSTPYGVAPNAIHPDDNDITPDPAMAERDRQRALADAIFVDLQNKAREVNRNPSIPRLPRT